MGKGVDMVCSGGVKLSFESGSSCSLSLVREVERARDADM